VVRCRGVALYIAHGEGTSSSLMDRLEWPKAKRWLRAQPNSYRMDVTLGRLPELPPPAPSAAALAACAPTGKWLKSNFRTGAPAANTRGRRGFVGTFRRGAPGASTGGGMVWLGGVDGSSCTVSALD
jgi:hypothetical protein